MSTENVDIRINAITKGQEGVKALKSNLQGLGNDAKKVQADWKKTTAIFASGAAAFYVTARAVGAVWDTLQEGAAMQVAQTKFDNLTNSIGALSSSMLNSLRAATNGMVTDMQLVASANQIMEVGLASDEKTVIRLAAATGKLGVDMNQLILELNTMKGMRLDQMGLSIVTVQAKAAAFELQGMGQRAAYTQAVLESMEEKIDLVGDVSETSAGKMARATATMTNSWNDAKIAIVETVDALGLFDQMDEMSAAAASARAFQTSLDGLVSSGKITSEMAQQLAHDYKWSADEADSAMRIVYGLAEAQKQEAAAAAVVSAQTASMAQQATSADVAMLGLANANALMAAGARVAEHALFLERLEMYNAALAAGQLTSATEGLAKRMKGGWNFANTTKAVQSYTGAVGEATTAQERFADAFSNELATGLDATTDAMKERQAVLDQGLVNDEGTANIAAINHELYEQAKAAGASAGQLALLGIATGEFTEAQAKAALKAALIQQKIMELSKAVSSGQLSFGDAIAGAQGYAVELDTATAQTSVEDLATSVDEYANGGPYNATVTASTAAAQNNLNKVIKALGDIDGKHSTAYVNVVTTGSAGGDDPTSPTPPAKPPHPGVDEERIGNRIPVGSGPEVVTTNASGRSHSRDRDSGGVFITVNNYIDGKQDRSALDTTTADTMKGALRKLGMGGLSV